MAPRREILDSEEEDDDFSPIRKPAGPPSGDEPIGTENDSLDSPRNRRAESTDPSFFRNVYDAQQVAANLQQATTSSLAPPMSIERDPTLFQNATSSLSHQGGQHDSAHLSSITDPVSASRRRQRKSEMKEVVDLTQVTTPGRPTPGVPADVWDFPVSPDAGTGAASSSIARTGSSKKKITIKLKKTETKRKHPNSSSGGVSNDLALAHSISEEEITPGTRSSQPRQKRRRISPNGQPSPNSQEVDLLIVPRSDDKLRSAKDYSTPNGNSSSAVEDSMKTRSTALLVVPNTLTASQKEEYRFVSLSSDTDRNHEHPGLPTAFGQVDNLQKSSGSATIKYPTPSEYASSGRRNPPPAESSLSEPPSSPDIISAPAANPPSTRKRKVSKPDNTNPEEDHPNLAPSSPPLRPARRRGKEKVILDELVSPSSAVAELEPPISSGRTKTPSRKRKDHGTVAPSSVELGIGATPTTDAQAPPDHDGDPDSLVEDQPIAFQEEPPQKSKRGRKRKEIPRENMDEEGLPEERQAKNGNEATQLQEEPAPKKRRGRPRKEARSEPIVIDDWEADSLVPDDDQAKGLDEEDEAAKPKRKRGRPRKSDPVKSMETDAPTDGDTGTGPQEKQASGGAGSEGHITAGKTGKKNGLKEVTTGEDENTGALSERDSNSNLAASPAMPGGSATDAADNTAKENQGAETKAKKQAAREDTKGGPSSSQLGKVQYRVGLSKRSRIAPLLKSFRK